MESCTFLKLSTSPASSSGAGETGEHQLLLPSHPHLGGDPKHFSTVHWGNFTPPILASGNKVHRCFSSRGKEGGRRDVYDCLAGSQLRGALPGTGGSSVWALWTGSGFFNYNETRGSGGFLTTRNPCLSPALGTGSGGGGGGGSTK